jgi:hypothetical protein
MIDNCSAQSMLAQSNGSTIFSGSQLLEVQVEVQEFHLCRGPNQNFSDEATE